VLLSIAFFQYFSKNQGQYDGYYAIVTIERGKSDAEIIETYFDF